MDGGVFKKLCESAFDFLLRSSREIDTEPKHALVSFAAGMELLLKARLLQEHWSLIILNKPDLKKFRKGDFVSVGTKEAMDRLNIVVGDPVPKDAAAAFDQVIAHRNSVVHFFHELDGDRFQQAIAKDMCLGWLYLRARINAWQPRFDDFQGQVFETDLAMKKVKGFLSTVFHSLRPELDALRKKSVVVARCPSCSFEAAPVDTVNDRISVQTCKVCSFSLNRIKIECQECEFPHTFNSWDQFQPIQCECGETILQSNVKDALDETDPYEAEVINCGDCTSVGTVIHHQGLYICIECASYADHIPHCEWCQEGQLNGGTLENSFLSGCEFCEGRGMD